MFKTVLPMPLMRFVEFGNLMNCLTFRLENHCGIIFGIPEDYNGIQMIISLGNEFVPANDIVCQYCVTWRNDIADARHFQIAISSPKGSATSEWMDEEETARFISRSIEFFQHANQPKLAA